jgi:hypothetical protein
LKNKNEKREKKRKNEGKRKGNRTTPAIRIVGMAIPQIIFLTSGEPAAERAGEGTPGPT